MNRTFVLGDIHGNYKGLMQLFKKSSFDYVNDELFFLGDICDGRGNQSYECMVELLKINKLYPCIGNHDIWLINWIKHNKIPNGWIEMGGEKTIDNFYQHCDYIDVIKNYFYRSKYWFFDKGRFFCHGGFNPKKEIVKQSNKSFAFNRTFFDSLKHLNKPIEIKLNRENITEIYIGHSVTKTKKPEIIRNVFCLDTGSGWDGKLTLMDCNTKEYWQSTNVKKHYG